MKRATEILCGLAILAGGVWLAAPKPHTGEIAGDALRPVLAAIIGVPDDGVIIRSWVERRDDRSVVLFGTAGGGAVSFALTVRETCDGRAPSYDPRCWAMVDGSFRDAGGTVIDPAAARRLLAQR